MHHLLLPILLVLSSTGCTLTEDNAAEVTAKKVCARHKSCDTDAWRDDFDQSTAVCRDEVTDDLDELVDFMTAANFEIDLDELKRCHNDIKNASCDDFEAGRWGNDCDDVFAFDF